MSGSATPTVFTRARVFDGHSFLDGPHDVVVQGGTIVSVSPSGSIASPTDAAIIPCEGSTVLPGMIDAHVHLTTAAGTSLDALSEPFSLQFFRAAESMRATLHSGITTVRDAGGTDLGAKVAQQRGIIEGPRLHLSVSVLSQTGGHADGWLRDGVAHPVMSEHPGRPSGVADGTEQVRAATRSIFRAGADQIKICTTGGVLSPYDDPAHSQFTFAEVRAIVEEAEMRGSYVMAHAQGTPGIRRALEAGVRSIEHGIYLDQQTADLMVSASAYLVPTLQAPLQVVRNADAGMPLLPQTVEKARRVVEDHRAAVALAHRAGVRIVMGTDAGVGPHGNNLEELELLVDAGLSDVEALRAATSTAAEMMRLERIGRIREQSVADLVVVRGDLRADGLAGLHRRIEQVWQEGVLRASPHPCSS